jgi:hypothetical protein
MPRSLKIERYELTSRPPFMFDTFTTPATPSHLAGAHVNSRNSSAVSTTMVCVLARLLQCIVASIERQVAENQDVPSTGVALDDRVPSRETNQVQKQNQPARIGADLSSADLLIGGKDGSDFCSVIVRLDLRMHAGGKKCDSSSPKKFPSV